jgi:hypothetical protein
MSLTIQGKKSAGRLRKIPDYDDNNEHWANARCRQGEHDDTHPGNQTIFTNPTVAVTPTTPQGGEDGVGGYINCNDKKIGWDCSNSSYAHMSSGDSGANCNPAGYVGSVDQEHNVWTGDWLPYVIRPDNDHIVDNYVFQRHALSVTRDATNKDQCQLDFNYDAAEGGYGLPQDGFQGFLPDALPDASPTTTGGGGCTGLGCAFAPIGNSLVAVEATAVASNEASAAHASVDANGWRTGFDTDNVQCAGDTTHPANEHPLNRTCLATIKTDGSLAQVTDACSGDIVGTESGPSSCKIKCQYEPETFQPRMNIFYQRAGDIGAGSCIPTSDTPIPATSPGRIQSCAVHKYSPTCNSDSACVWIPRNTEQQPHGIRSAITDQKCMRRNKHGVYPGYYCTSTTDNACSDTVIGQQEGQILGTVWTRAIDASSGTVSYTNTRGNTVTAIPAEVEDIEQGREQAAAVPIAKINSKLGACFYTGDIHAEKIMFDENEIKKRVAIISEYKEKFVPPDGEGSHCNYGTIMADFCQNIDASYKRGGLVPGETDPNLEKGFQSFYSSENPALHETGTSRNICKTWYTSTTKKAKDVAKDTALANEIYEATALAAANANSPPPDQPVVAVPGDTHDVHDDWLSNDCDGYGTTSHQKMGDSIKAVCDTLVGVWPGATAMGKITNPENLDKMCKCLKKEDRLDYYLPYTTDNDPAYHLDARCWNSGCMYGNDEYTYLEDTDEPQCPNICIVGVFIGGNTAGNSQTFNVQNNNINASCPSPPTEAHCLYTSANALVNTSIVATDDGSRCTLDPSNRTCTAKDATTSQCSFVPAGTHTSTTTSTTPDAGPDATPGADDATPGATPGDDDATPGDDDATPAATATATATVAAAKATKLNEMLFAGLAAAILVPWLFIPGPWWFMLIINVVAIVVVYTLYKREKKKST